MHGRCVRELSCAHRRRTYLSIPTQRNAASYFTTNKRLMRELYKNVSLHCVSLSPGRLTNRQRTPPHHTQLSQAHTLFDTPGHIASRAVHNQQAAAIDSSSSPAQTTQLPRQSVTVKVSPPSEGVVFVRVSPNCATPPGLKIYILL